MGPKVHSCIHNSLQLDPVLSGNKPVNILKFCILKTEQIISWWSVGAHSIIIKLFDFSCNVLQKKTASKRLHGDQCQQIQNFLLCIQLMAFKPN